MTGRPKNPRPTKYSQVLADEIVDLYSNGRTLLQIEQENDHLPTQITIYKWLDQFEVFRACYERARELHAQSLINQAIDIADNAFDAVRARNQIMIRQFVAGKNSQRYADKVDINVNHKVSITAALAEANKRLTIDPPNVIEGQVIGIIEQPKVRASDNKSEHPDGDIFS